MQCRSVFYVEVATFALIVVAAWPTRFFKTAPLWEAMRD
jgi:hypothetical protein